MMSTKILVLALALVALFVLGSTDVSAYYSFSNYPMYHRYGGYGYGYGSGYASGTSYGSIIGPLWYRTSYVSPYVIDSSLAFDAYDPMTQYSYRSTGQLYDFVLRNSYSY